MGEENRLQRRMDRRDFKNFIPSNEEEATYFEVAKRVKRIRGFYTHAIIFGVVNCMFVVINIQNLNPGESYFKFQNLMTLTFWGLGLLAHGLSVFLPTFILGQNWEARKIKELMEKERNNQNQWN